MPRFGRIVGACDRPLRSSGGRSVRSPPAAPRSPLALVALLASSITLADDIVARSVCDTPPHDRLCSVAPKDNTDFDASFIYLNLEKNAQNPFDIFSWQTFVALNWPANDAGVPIGEPIGTRPDLRACGSRTGSQARYSGRPARTNHVPRARTRRCSRRT